MTGVGFLVCISAKQISCGTVVNIDNGTLEGELALIGITVVPVLNLCLDRIDGDAIRFTAS